MSNTLTIVIPNRNRDLKLVEKSLNSIHEQLNDNVRLVLVDYGSGISYQDELKEHSSKFPLMEIIYCPCQQQLWNKSRAINLVLKHSTSSHFMVCDMDMIWHPDFIKLELPEFSNSQSVYYTVGIMTQEESSKEVAFIDYKVKFKTDYEATGITVFPVEHLKSINGFDEFYHGWGSEDTDVHVRLRNAGYEVRFRESEVLFKHQWHAKSYRSKKSSFPYHPYLERINHSYFTATKEVKKIKANYSNNWGKSFNLEDYKALDRPDVLLKRHATEEDIKSFIFFLGNYQDSGVIKLMVTAHTEFNTLKTTAKKVLGKKTPLFISLERVNEMLLEALILRHHDQPHTYSFNRVQGEIKLVIHITRVS
ncbi:hypothetical protein BST92_09720 [Nonlabens arenilitoris]|uniref:Galactosyltransferase C-terminal domain-containing protein n=1 Tax=Nonlabens arenilitoris TaxID=1217969 RepID=A0A2S7UB88_9FLAO|nr:galactosyltransferase-related protein [Nonlabens arenilitoris]PQJ32185.1 hypothetical protein BST92_09720 [Nonlabens arenilitoris]